MKLYLKIPGRGGILCDVPVTLPRSSMRLVPLLRERNGSSLHENNICVNDSSIHILGSCTMRKPKIDDAVASLRGFATSTLFNSW